MRLFQEDLKDGEYKFKMFYLEKYYDFSISNNLKIICKD